MKDGSIAITGLDRLSRANFLRKVNKYVLKDGKLYFNSNIDEYKLVIADDDAESQLTIFNLLHLPDHTGMKAMYKSSLSQYIGFKRERINSYAPRSNDKLCTELGLLF